MLKKFSTQKSEGEIIKNAISMSYDGENIASFLAKTDEVENQAKFNREETFGLVRESLSGYRMILLFVSFRSAKDYAEVK